MISFTQSILSVNSCGKFNFNIKVRFSKGHVYKTITDKKIARIVLIFYAVDPLRVHAFSYNKVPI